LPRVRTRRAAPFPTRREAVLALAAGVASGCATAPPSRTLTLYSPAPPTNPLHALNLQLAAAMSDARLSIETVATPLPDSINQIAALPGHEKHRHLPIVTTVDFRLARAGAGPAWHAYHQAHPDLRFVAKVYEVGFGLQTIAPEITRPADLRGKRIGVPARPSAVRLLTEALLGDGWNILDSVELIEVTASDAMPALTSGAIDATTWNLVAPAADGFRLILPAPPSARFLPVERAHLERINARNFFTLALSVSLNAGPPLLSFAQALAAWDSTGPATIAALLERIVRAGSEHPGLPRSIAEMAAWPALTVAEIHPAARTFYAAHSSSRT